MLERLEGLAMIAAETLVDEQVTLMRDSPREYLALADATSDLPALCVDDARYTFDRPALLTVVDTAEMRAICSMCHAVVQCDAFATAALPPVGFWAGRQYPEPKDDTAA
ncbi:hypothetical protein [Microbacterium sp. SA39]|uniref:hypothetical protein n=1 Tax=Microbacterium sp. SA39 TaxID=1263625 RepID=UPI0012698F3C|nr:hypothetical protein [Microbacterium sp. SA39]